jgi:hypothetical protein
MLLNADAGSIGDWFPKFGSPKKRIEFPPNNDHQLLQESGVNLRCCAGDVQFKGLVV